MLLFSTVTIDIGTTSVKLCLFDAEGALITSDKYATPTVPDAHGEIYDADALLGGVLSFMHGLASERRRDVKRIAITGVGESGGLVRQDLSLASPLVLWHDHRGAKYLEGLTEEQRSHIYRVTGLPVNGNYALSKVAWAFDQATDASDAQWLNVAEYLAATMTGERWSEPSLASRTMALDLAAGAWSEEISSMVGVGVEAFAPLRPAGEGVRVTRSFAGQSGVHREAEVHVVGHDHMVGGVGAGLEPDEVFNSTGTTEGVLVLNDRPRVDLDAERSKLANGMHCVAPLYTLFASIPTGGSAFSTLQGMLGLSASELATVLESLHTKYVSGDIRWNEIPLVLPEFRGSPPPDKLSAARGAISGIGPDTTREDIVFGTFLGMALQFRDVLELFQVHAESLKVIGPASGNALWLQLKADVLGLPLSVSSFPEVVSRGAQILAAQGAGDWSSNSPQDIAASSLRHEHIAEWASASQQRWAGLKGLYR